MSNIAKAIFVACLLASCVLWSQSRYAQPSSDYQLAFQHHSTPWKRIPFAASLSDLSVGEDEVPTLLIITPVLLMSC